MTASAVLGRGRGFSRYNWSMREPDKLCLRRNTKNLPWNITITITITVSWNVVVVSFTWEALYALQLCVVVLKTWFHLHNLIRSIAVKHFTMPENGLIANAKKLWFLLHYVRINLHVSRITIYIFEKFIKWIRYLIDSLIKLLRL